MKDKTTATKSKLMLAVTGIVLLLLIVGAAGWLLFLRPPAPYELPVADWNTFRHNCITAEGRVIDDGNGNITHSEGQGYGMLIAEAYADRATFDRIWAWTKKNLQTRPNDKLLSWLWKPNDTPEGGAVADPNNASDGDLLVAWALARASKRWNEFSYEQASLQIIADLRRLDYHTFKEQLVLLPGTDGFVKPEGIILNPSYYIFQAFRELGQVFPDPTWMALDESGQDLIRKARFGKWNLSPEWVMMPMEGDLSLPIGFPHDFGYNAVRIPLYIIWASPDNIELLQPFADFWKQSAGQETPATVNLDTNAPGPDPALPGMLAIAQLTLATVEKRKLTVPDIPSVSADEVYYSACLKILVKMVIKESATIPSEA